MPRAPKLALSLAGVALALAPLAAAAQLPVDRMGAMSARTIGPAGMSGRVSAIDVVLDRPDTIFVGASTGGVWRSENGGTTWTPVFDDQEVIGVGDVRVFQPDPRIVWVGTGEGNPRNSAGVGNGIYKSTDFGRTWQHLGLEKSERIHRVVTHPTDPDVVYAGAMGPMWSDGTERGVFKTTDGGRTWRKVLYVDEKTGVADLVMDPSNPNKLFAAMWEFRRWPWFFNSGGSGSGLFVSEDAGETWRKLTAADGLPAGDLGRIGVAFSRSNPQIVTALVEAERSALIRSRDGGRTWQTLNDEEGIANRPFYYGDIRVHPRDPNRIYSLYSRLAVSADEGKTWATVVPSSKIHGDIQELWIHPSRDLMLQGNDGGVGISRDDGETWHFVENLPLAQFYHLDVDDAVPFNVYGGMQDNGSWVGPSRVWENKSIRNQHWLRVGGGDGFRTMDDPTDPASGYTMSQQGNLRRFNRVTGEQRDIQPIAPAPDDELRFNWNAGFAIDPFDPRTIYLGSQYVHRSTDRGESWSVISPDLTTDDPEKQRQAESGGLTIDASGAENHTTIMTISPSPVQRGVIWVGTDDANVQLTRDGGQSWTNLIGNIRGVPAGTWVPHIEPSRFEAGTAFVVFDNHRRGDWTPYVFRTTDFGRTWQSLATPEIRGFAHTLEQDPVVPDLLFLGTEFGMYVSTTGGRSWTKWTHGLPSAPVVGLALQPREVDLAVGTHGRAAYILDDVRPLRALARDPEIARRPLHLFETPVAWQHEIKEMPGYRSTGDAMFEGENRPYGALLSFWAGEGVGDSATVEIAGADGGVVRTLRRPVRAGLNRFAWDLRTDGLREPDGDRMDGPEVLPGTYVVRIRAGGRTVEGPLEVRFDPRASIPLADRQRKMQALQRLIALTAPAMEAMARLDAAPAGAGRDAARESLDDALDQARSLYRSLQSSFDAPTRSQLDLLQRLESRLPEAARQAGAIR